MQVVVVGLVLGVVYIVIGIVLAVKTSPAQSVVPLWRLSSGVVIVLIGVISTVISIYLCAQPQKIYTPCSKLIRLGLTPDEKNPPAAKYRLVSIEDVTSKSVAETTADTIMASRRVRYNTKTREVRKEDDVRIQTELSSVIIHHDRFKFIDGCSVVNCKISDVEHTFILVKAHSDDIIGLYHVIHRVLGWSGHRRYLRDQA